MLRQLFAKSLLLVRQNPTFVLTALIFFLFWDIAVIEEYESPSRWAIGGGAATGAAAGGYAGWFIGGIGVVAMGTGVGIPAAAVMGIGALLGVTAGGAAGNWIGSWFSHAIPRIDPVLLVAVFCMSLGASVIIVKGAAIATTWIGNLRNRLFGKKVD